MSETVTLSYEETADIQTMLDKMEDKGTLRSRTGGSVKQMREKWLVGFASQKALCKFFDETYNTPATIDTRAYDDVSADSGDIMTIDGVRAEPCEVKKTKQYANHVAVTKTEMRLIDEDEPIVYVQTDWDGTKKDCIEFEIAGWCKKEDLHLVEQGEKPWTANDDNWCQPLDDMRTDWKELIEYLSRGGASPSRFSFS